MGSGSVKPRRHQPKPSTFRVFRVFRGSKLKYHPKPCQLRAFRSLSRLKKAFF